MAPPFLDASSNSRRLSPANPSKLGAIAPRRLDRDARPMKITDLKTFVVANPPPHNGGPYWVFVKLVSDSGIVGYGEAYCIPFHPSVVARMIEDVGERYVIGSDPFKIELLWRRVYSSGYSQKSDLSLIGVLSALETACWDIVGKELNKPVYELLGGQVHEKLRSYTYIYPEEGADDSVYLDPDIAAERAAHYAGLPLLRLRPAPAVVGGAGSLGNLRAPDPRGRRRPLRLALRHPRAVHRGRRHPPGAAIGAL
jgi:L-alanine-DL-glutamate epimerase-like enolase superfamily enzyme